MKAVYKIKLRKMKSKEPSQTRRVVNAAALGTAAGLLTRNPYIGLGTAGVTYLTKFTPIPIGGSKSKKRSKRSKMMQKSKKTKKVRFQTKSRRRRY
jgi:hypothetical protein